MEFRADTFYASKLLLDCFLNWAVDQCPAHAMMGSHTFYNALSKYAKSHPIGKTQLKQVHTPTQTAMTRAIPPLRLRPLPLRMAMID
jgi:hypothetical protein|eukprot:5285890-Prymnesium_polylepis.1